MTKRVVIVVTYTYPFIGSGIGNVALKEAELLVEEGYEVTLISANNPKSEQSFTRNGVNHIKIMSWEGLNRFHVPVPLFLFNKTAIQAIKQADIVHVHDILYPSSFQATFIASFFQKKIILTQHVPHVEYKNKLINLVEKIAFHTIGSYICSKAVTIFVFNPHVEAWLKKYKEKIVYLYNGVDTNIYHPVTQDQQTKLRQIHMLPLDKPLVLFVGRLVPKKGFEKLYEARHDNYMIIFAGGGMKPEHMVNNSKTRFIGNIDPVELAELYQLSDLFILPSKGEGFPLSLQEAMASGLPVIVGEDKTYDTVLDKHYVLSIKSEPEFIQNSINTVLNDKPKMKLMSTYSIQKAANDFSWEHHMILLLGIYNSS